MISLLFKKKYGNSVVIQYTKNSSMIHSAMIQLKLSMIQLKLSCDTTQSTVTLDLTSVHQKLNTIKDPSAYSTQWFKLLGV